MIGEEPYVTPAAALLPHDFFETLLYMAASVAGAMLLAVLCLLVLALYQRLTKARRTSRAWRHRWQGR